MVSSCSHHCSSTNLIYSFFTFFFSEFLKNIWNFSNLPPSPPHSEWMRCGAPSTWFGYACSVWYIYGPGITSWSSIMASIRFPFGWALPYNLYFWLLPLGPRKYLVLTGTVYDIFMESQWSQLYACNSQFAFLAKIVLKIINNADPNQKSLRLKKGRPKTKKSCNANFFQL